MLSAWCAKHSPVPFVFSLDSLFQNRCKHPAVTSLEEHWQDKWLGELIIVGKLMALFCHAIANFVMTECAYISFIDVPSLVCEDPRYLNYSISFSVFPFIRLLIGGFALMLLTWWEFCFCQSWFPCHNKQQFSLVFQGIVGVLRWNYERAPSGVPYIFFQLTASSLLRITRCITLLRWLIRLIVLLFGQSHVLPFFRSGGIISDIVQSLGHKLSTGSDFLTYDG